MFRCVNDDLKGYLGSYRQHYFLTFAPDMLSAVMALGDISATIAVICRERSVGLLVTSNYSKKTGKKKLKRGNISRRGSRLPSNKC